MDYTYTASLKTPDFAGDDELEIAQAAPLKSQIIKLEGGLIRLLARLNEMSREELSNKAPTEMINPQRTVFEFSYSGPGGFASKGAIEWTLGDTEREFLRAAIEGVAAEVQARVKRIKRDPKAFQRGSHGRGK